LKSDYRYALAFYKEDKTPLGQVPLEVDWEPAVECARFGAFRKDVLAPEDGSVEAAIEPIWLKAPYLSGFRVAFERNGTTGINQDFDTDYFAGLAKGVVPQLVESGKLAENERYFFLAVAFPAEKDQDEPAKLGIVAQPVTPSLALKSSSLPELTREASPVGALSDDVPVFLPERVLGEVEALAREACPKETGGILIGHLHRDSDLPELAAEVTAQIHARRAEADSVRLNFTAACWTDVKGALELRGQGEIMLGWWHSHPVREWCKDCSNESQEGCALARDFFSAHDRALHRAVFPRAYSIALVANDVGVGDLSFSLFGWRNGLIAPRGYHLKGKEAPNGCVP